MVPIHSYSALKIDLSKEASVVIVVFITTTNFECIIVIVKESKPGVEVL